MAEQIVYEIRIEGTQQQATRLNEIEVELAQINKERKTLLDLMKEGVELGEKEEKHLAKLTAQSSALKQEKAKMNREINNTIKANTAAVGSYNALTAANAKLIAKAKDMGDITGKNKVQFEQITAKIKSNTDKLKELDAAMGNHQRNVGNYSAAIRDAFGQMGFFSREMAIAQSALNVLKAGMTSAAGTTRTAFTIIKAALISSGVGAILVGLGMAIGGLIKYFNSSSEAALKFKNAIAPVTALVGNLFEILQGVGKALFDAFSNISNFWGTLTGGLRDVRDQMGSLMEDTRQEAALLRDMNNQRHLNAQLEIEDIKKLAKLEADIAEARDIAANKEDYTVAQRRKAMKDAFELNKQIHQINMDAAAREIAVLNLKKVQEERDNQVKIETQKELAEAQAAYYQADRDFFSEQRGMRRQMLKIDKEYIELQKQMTETLNERNEAMRISQQEQLDGMMQVQTAMVDTALRTEMTKTMIADMEAQKRKSIAQTEHEYNMTLATEAVAMASSLFSQNTAAYKVTASAEALMSTYLSANKALAQLPVPFSFIMAALLTAKGLQNVAAINNVQFASGGVVPSGYELPGSTPQGDNTLALVKPGEVILNKHQQARLGGASTFAAIGVPGFADGGMVPSMKIPTPVSQSVDMTAITRAMRDQRVYVLESDITKKQKNVRVIESLSSF